MDTEREALQCTAYPEVQSFCQRHGLAFEVVDLRWGIPNTQATDHLTAELCLEELERCQRSSVGPAFVALLGGQYGPCPVPQRIEEKEWEALRAQLTSRPRDLELVTRHFQRDDNTIPPTYVLQPPGALVVPGPEEATLASVLRAGAQEAWRLGLISQEQWMCYHRSVIEWEIERGLLNSARGDQGATVFLRDVQDLSKHILDDCSLKMVDRLADGCLDTDAQSLLSGLKGRILEAQPGALKSHHLPWSRDLVNPKNKTHARYLKQLSEQFVARANCQVLEQLRELDSGRQELGWLYQEIRHHLWQSTESTKVFCGHQELLAGLGQRLKQDESQMHTPLVLFGPPGIGKTSLMCKLAQQVPELLGHKTVAVLRLLGTSRLSLDARGLLRSLSFQLCLAYGLPLPPAQVLEAHSRVGHFFHTLLHTVSQRNFESLVLLLDSVDDLDSICHSPRVSWLPLKCPPRVHLILSACSGQQVLRNLRQTLQDPSAFWEVKALSGSQGREFIQLLLAEARRTLSPGQRDVLWASLPECGHPGRLRLAFEEARKWASFTVPVPLATSAEEATHQLCIRLEETHGPLLVAHVLGYIVSSRYGLSEAELKDVLSLDDEVLQAVYRDWTPPSKELLRFPPLLWVRLRRDLGHCLVRRPVDGCMLLAIAHRQLSQVIQARYLSGPERAKRHGVLAEFFSGAWSQGIKKLITLPLVGKPLNLDRKVAPQPLWFSGTVANWRKLTELPFHLLHAGRLEELKQEVLGNMSWISCRGISGGIEDLLDDFDMCAPHMDCPEVYLIREAIQLCGPAIELRGLEKSVLYTELLARLLFFAASHPAMIGQLCQQAQSWFRACPYPMLVPLAGFLQPPGGPLRATLTGCHKGITAVAWSLEEKLLVVGTQDGTMVVWDVEEQQVVHVLMGHTAEVRCVRVFAQGTLAISASKDHTLRLWSLLSGREKVTILDGGLPNPIEPQSWGLHVDEINKVVYSTSGAKINVWNLETSKLVFCITGDVSDPWVCVALLAAQGLLLALSKGGQVSLWSSAVGKLQEKHQLSSIKEETPTCAVSIPTQARLVAGFSSGSIALVSAGEDKLLEKLPEAVGLLVVSEDDSLLAAGFGRCVRIYLADSQGFHQFMASDLEHEDVVETAVWGPENNLIITGSQDTLIQVWDLRSTQKLPSPTPFLDRTGLTAVSHYGSYVYFPKVGDKNKVTIWDLAEGEEHDSLDTSNEVCCLEVAEQAKLLFTGLISGIVLVFPLNSRQDVLCIPPPEARKAVNCMSLSKSEDRLAIAYDNIVLVLDISPGDPCPAIEGPTYTFYTQLPETIVSVAVLADYRVVYGMSDGSLFLYDCAWSKVFPLEAHGSRVSCVEVSHGEQLAVSGAEDPLLCLWDLQACRGVFEMSYESSCCRGVRCACFSKDDKHIFAGMEDRSVTAWSTLDGTLLAVQFVHAVINRIIPTSNGFMAPTSHGYLIRERFQCPSVRASQQDPLKNFKKAVWLVKTRQREEMAVAEAPQNTEPVAVEGKESKSNKRSQVCLIL
ncbi:NACHT domain- and WD repeat-containing protein 1 isoform X2 [Apodemus sylvaticus]|uniref:NACHT domain- and WD repeat-containing protein 1 isoform X2 n=1 Tax=Apodemus sylvaticus TaxID=10129 RepID=UPI002243088D|nr:NACHT domain- and WD repeat-containing protein 1 isoform X2 [Apodemus sylvaticus]